MYLPCPRSQSHDKTPLTALSPSPASTQSENTQMHSNAGLKYVGQKGVEGPFGVGAHDNAISGGKSLGCAPSCASSRPSRSPRHGCRYHAR